MGDRESLSLCPMLPFMKKKKNCSLTLQGLWPPALLNISA